MKNIDDIKNKAYLEFLKRWVQTPKDEAINLVANPATPNAYLFVKKYNDESKIY